MKGKARNSLNRIKKVKFHITAKEVCQKLGISVLTLNLWYKWWESDIKKPAHCPKLPNYIIIDGRGTRM